MEMDPLSLTYFFIILPIAVLASAYFVMRFRSKYRKQMKNYKADELAKSVDYEIYPAGPSDPNDPANRRDVGQL